MAKIVGAGIAIAAVLGLSGCSIGQSAGGGPDTNAAPLTTGMTRDGLKMEMSDIYTAIFHRSSVDVQSVAVTAWGPMQDQYGNTSYQMVYGTTLTSDVADKINWNLDTATLDMQIIPGLWTAFLGNGSLGLPQN